MRKLLIAPLLLIVALASPARATWSKIQVVCNTACATGTTCGITVAATGTGNLIVVKLIGDTAGATATLSSVSGGGTYTHCSNCNKAPANGTIDASYTLASTSGATTITLTASASLTAWRACMEEDSSNTGSIALDTGATPSCSATIATAAPVSCATTVSGANLVIATAMLWSGTLSGLSAPCGDFLVANGNGAGHNLNVSVGTGCSWTPTTNGSGASFSIVFKEAAAAGSSFGYSKQRRYERVDE